MDFVIKIKYTEQLGQSRYAQEFLLFLNFKRVIDYFEGDLVTAVIHSFHASITVGTIKIVTAWRIKSLNSQNFCQKHSFVKATDYL